jgi:ComF family protein
MSLLDQFISKLAPHDCLGCGYEGSLVCASCAEEHLKPIPERCYRCRKISAFARTCSACRKTSRLQAVKVAVVYEGLAKELVWQLKFKGAQAAVAEMVKCMAPLGEDACIVPVPTATGRVRRRGYDQAKLLARGLARSNRALYVDCLMRSGQAHQVGASRQERLHQLASALRVRNSSSVRGKRIILVDDVVTTGATLEAAAVALKTAGADCIEAVVYAQP